MAKHYSRVIVTGGAGFIGGHIVDRLLKEGFDVTVIDNLSMGRLENIAQNEDKREFHFVKGDIRDFDLVKNTMKDIDAVFHEAASASVTLSLKNPMLVNDINVLGTLNLLKAAVELDVKRFIFASSAAVYGETALPRKGEEIPPDPTQPYGVSKLAAESYTRSFCKSYGLETVSLRYFNVYGPRQSFDINCAYGGAITIFLNRLMRSMPPIIYGDGEQTRDFVYVQDIVEANMLALNTKNAVGEFFNIGSGTAISVNQVAQVLKERLNKKDIKNVYAAERPAEVKHGYADISKAKRILNYTPRFLFEEGITNLVDWYSKDEDLSI
jgi:UDP-glucose 4-epimerase